MRKTIILQRGMLKPVSVFVFCFFILSSISLSPIHAKNLGVWGTLYPITEQDILVFIKERLETLKKKGELAKLKKQFIQNVKAHVLRPTPVRGLTTTTHPRTFYYDPTFVLQRDIRDANGRVLFAKGRAVNPLDTVTLHAALFFFNAEDKRQIGWAIKNAKRFDFVKFICVGGNIQEASQKVGGRVYFDQAGLLTRKLGLTHIPCIVTQHRHRLMIQEVALPRGDGREV